MSPLVTKPQTPHQRAHDPMHSSPLCPRPSGALCLGTVWALIRSGTRPRGDFILQLKDDILWRSGAFEHLRTICISGASALLAITTSLTPSLLAHSSLWVKCWNGTEHSLMTSNTCKVLSAVQAQTARVRIVVSFLQCHDVHTQILEGNFSNLLLKSELFFLYRCRGCGYIYIQLSFYHAHDKAEAKKL